jgi:hypothetical protein
MMRCWLVVALGLAVPRPIAAPPSSFDDLISDLAARIAAVVPSSDRVHVVVAGDGATTPAGVRTAIVQRLTARGFQISEAAAGATVLTVACSTNLRERVCAADVAKAGGARETLFATGPIPSDADADGPAAMLDMRHVFSQRAAILDVALLGDRVIVLDPAAMTMYQRAGYVWQKVRAQPIASSRVWPRDMRGRLRVAGQSIEAYLPGVVCRANLESFVVSCADERQPWPLPVDNTGIAAGRNYFTTPEGLAFYGSAALESDSGARWLLVGDQARLMLLDDGRRPVDAALGEADDVAGVSGCGSGAFVLAGSHTPANDGRDIVRLFRVVERRMIPAAPALVLPGALTAMWSSSFPVSAVATAIVRDPLSDRYDAIQIEVACGR